MLNVEKNACHKKAFFKKSIPKNAGSLVHATGVAIGEMAELSRDKGFESAKSSNQLQQLISNYLVPILDNLQLWHLAHNTVLKIARVAESGAKTGLAVCHVF